MIVITGGHFHTLGTNYSHIVVFTLDNPINMSDTCTFE